jgi:hypothetical protein
MNAYHGIVYQATLAADPTTGNATVTVLGADLAPFAAGSRLWYDVRLTVADSAQSPFLVVNSSLWIATSATGPGDAVLLCTAQDVSTPGDGSDARVARRLDIEWPAGANGTIALAVQHADATSYDLTGCALTLYIRTPASAGGLDASVLPSQATTQTVMDDLTHALLTLQPNLVVLGPNDAAGEARPPTIAWRPSQTRWEVGGTRMLGRPSEPGLLWSRWLDVVFEIFGGDVGVPDYGLTPTEGLIELVINCLQQRFTLHAYRPRSERWLQMGRTGRGLGCELIVAIRVPLVRIDNPSVTIKAFTETIHIGVPEASDE